MVTKPHITQSCQFRVEIFAHTRSGNLHPENLIRLILDLSRPTLIALSTESWREGRRKVPLMLHSWQHRTRRSQGEAEFLRLGRQRRRLSRKLDSERLVRCRRPVQGRLLLSQWLVRASMVLRWTRRGKTTRRLPILGQSRNQHRSERRHSLFQKSQDRSRCSQSRRAGIRS